MPLQWSRATIPLGRGMSQALDERVQPVDTLASCKNVQFDKRGAIVKRPGFDYVPSNLPDGTAIAETLIRGIFSTGRELCLAGYQHLYALNETSGAWWRRGRISPVSVSSLPGFNDSVDYRTSDLAVANGVTLYATTAFRTDDTGDFVFSLTVSSRDADGNVLLGTTTLASGVASALPSDAPHAPRCAAVGDHVFVLIMRGSDATLLRPDYELYRYDTTAPEIAPALMWNSVNFGGYFKDWDRRVFDMIRAGPDSVHIARITRTGGPPGRIALDTIDSGGAVLASGILSAHAPYEEVALALDEAGGKLYVLASGNPAGGPPGNSTIYLYQLDAGTYATNWTQIQLAFAGEFVNNIGVAYGVIGGAPSIVSVVSSSTTLYSQQLTRRMINTPAGVLTSGAAPMNNVTAASRPFIHRDRAYVALNRAETPNPQSGSTGDIGYGGVWDLEMADPTLTPTFVAFVDDAAQNPFNVAEGWGVPPNAQVIADKVHYVLNFAGIGRSLKQIILDFDSPATAASAAPGALAISGGFVSWYAGAIVEELGWIAAPNALITGTPTPGTPEAHAAIWQTVDEVGFVHRSPPSPASTPITKLNPSNAFVTTLPASNRFTPQQLDEQREAQRKTSVVFYKVDAGGVFLRAAGGQPNLPDEQYTEAAGVALNPIGAALYTESRELEAVAPTGCRIVRRVADRFWYADMAEPSRVQYTKVFTPGTASVRPAPETNRAFSVQAPGGESVTGIGDLDDKVVVLTDKSVYMLAGAGPGNDGAANDFSSLTAISSATGCVDPRSVASFPDGVMFRGQRGFYVVTRGLDVKFAGEAVRDLSSDFPIVTAAVTVPEASEVRLCCSNGHDAIILVFNYLHSAWSYWQLLDPSGNPIDIASAVLHGSEFYVVDKNTNIYRQNTAGSYRDNGMYYSMQIVTAWLQGAAQSGWQRVRRLIPLCETLDPHDLNISVYNDFDDTAPSQNHVWTAAEIASFPGASMERTEIRLARQKCTAVKLRIGDTESPASVTGRGFSIAGIVAELGIKSGTVKPAPAQRS